MKPPHASAEGKTGFNGWFRAARGIRSTVEKYAVHNINSRRRNRVEFAVKVRQNERSLQ